MEEKNWSPFAEVYDPLMCGSIDRTDTDPHDHGIVRALNATYKPDTSLVNDPQKTIFISNIDQNTTEEEMRRHFSEHGPIKYCRLVTDLVTGYSKGYAFLEFEDRYDAMTARNRAHKTVVNGREIVVEFELERTLPGWKPRRLGGGFGGRKGSGQLRFGGRERPFRKPIQVEEQSSPYRRSIKLNLEGRDMEFGERGRSSDERHSRSQLRERKGEDRRGEGGGRMGRDKRDRGTRERESRDRDNRDRDRDRRDRGNRERDNRGRDRDNRDRDNRDRDRDNRQHRDREKDNDKIDRYRERKGRF